MVEGLSDVVQISTLANATCALRNDGTVWCWGSNTYGELAVDVEEVEESFMPVQIQGL